MNNSYSKPQFKAVLSARTNDGRPSDLEFLLRSHCQKIKVVKKLSGAHLMIKQDSTNVAVRAYFSHSLQELSESKSQTTLNTQDCDFDDLSTFLKLKVSVIFFILPVEEQRKQLDDPLSLFQRAQKMVQQVTQSEMGKVARIFLLSNPAKAVDLLYSIAKTLHPSTKAKKHQYFAQKHQQLFLPQANSFIPSTSHPHGAKHVRQTIVDWAERFEFPPTEAEMMCNMMKNLRSIASADGGVLQQLPLDPRTKECTMQFFGTGSQEMPSQQIQLGAEVPPSPLTIPEMQQLQEQMLDQHQQYNQVPPPQMQQNTPVMQQPKSTPMGGLTRFGGNPNANRTSAVVQQQSNHHSFAQYSASRGGLSPMQNSRPNPSHATPASAVGRFGPPTRRTIYQETILTAASIPAGSQGYPMSQHDMPPPPFRMQNPPGSAMQHHHPPPQHPSYTTPNHSNHHSTYHPPMSNHHHHHPSQQTPMAYGGSSQAGSVMGNSHQQQYGGGQGIHIMNGIDQRMGYGHHQPAATPMANSRGPSTFRRPAPPRRNPTFPPRRPRRFVP